LFFIFYVVYDGRGAFCVRLYEGSCCRDFCVACDV